jgi:cytochrome oxidase Cu insertion factor (SCO1/SenC/PrrC family)
MIARLATITVLGLAFGALVALLALPGARERLIGPPVAQSTTTGKALVGGPFALQDPTGKTVTDADFRGRTLLVFFGYTYCPDVCPATLQVIAAALDKLGDRADRIAPLFISVDPDRDTPQRMGEYVKSFSPRIIGLTGSTEAINAVKKAYRAFAQKAPGSGSDYTVDHSAIIYVMGPDGSYLAHFTPATTVDQMATRLGELVAASG